jgi:endo-1,4-beta-xylanase
MRRIPNRTATLLSLSLGLLAGCGPQAGDADLTSAQAPASLATLRAAAEASGRFFGVGIQASKLTDTQYTAIAAREFDMVTPENELKTLAFQEGVFDFTSGDAIYNWAAQRGMRMRGHSLLWLTGLPSYLLSYDQTKMRAFIADYVETVVTHYRGKLASWDVVSEAFFDNGTVRSPIWRNAGSDWVELAFKAARAADSTVELCYEDYGIEDWTSPKTQAVYSMVRDFKSRGIPIDCVGFESHFVGGITLPASFQTTLDSFARLGVKVTLSELDVTNATPSVYAGAVNACLAVAGCTGITVWGVRDSDSWRSSEGPLLFTQSGEKKPAYTAVLDALNQATPVGGGGGGVAVDTQPPSAPGTPSWSNQDMTVTLSWPASTDDQGVVGYQLFYGNFLLGTFDSPIVTMIGFKPGVAYVFSLKAVDAAGNVSASSPQVTVLPSVPVDTTPPTAPTNLVVSTVGSTYAVLKWTASTDDTGVVIYQIYSNSTVVGTTTSPSATISNLQAGTTYSFSVRAFDAAGNTSNASAAVLVTTATCLLGCSASTSEL